MCRKAAPYGGMQSGSYGEKEKSRESKAKDTMVETERDKRQEVFRQEVTRILGGKDGLPDEWDQRHTYHDEKLFSLSFFLY